MGHNITSEQSLRESKRVPRIHQLDALRGIAAATVVAHHLRLFIRPTAHPTWYAVPFFAGPQAVNLFFVLSGFVLALPYWSGKSLPYPVYLLRRFIRIWLPFAGAVILSVFGAFVFRNYQPQLAHFTAFWHDPLSPRLVAYQFLMPLDQRFNLAFWSLHYEMILSVIMPLLVWLLVKGKPALVLPVACAIGFGSTGAIEFLNANPWHIGEITQIACLFLVGAAIAQHKNSLCAKLHRLGYGRWVLLALSLFLYFDYPGLMSVHIEDRSTLVSGLGAAGIILCSLAIEQFAGLLKHSVFEFLGRISYSLYLIHSVVLLASFDLFFGKVPLPALLVTSYFGAILVAYLFWLIVENPAVKLTQAVKVAGRKPRVAAEPVGA